MLGFAKGASYLGTIMSPVQWGGAPSSRLLRFSTATLSDRGSRGESVLVRMVMLPASSRLRPASAPRSLSQVDHAVVAAIERHDRVGNWSL